MSVTSNKEYSYRPYVRFGKNLIHKAVGALKQPALLTSVAVTALLLGVRHLSWLEPWELSVYDQSLQLRPALGPDPRLLVVTITEDDIHKYNWPVPDKVMGQLLKKLEQYQPAVIGLDNYRDVPVGEGHQELVTLMQKSDRIIAVCQFKEDDKPEVLPPPSVSTKRVGFSDLLLDPDGVIRRSLLFIDKPPANSGCNTLFSFSFQLARGYGISPRLTPEKNLQIKNVVFKPLPLNGKVGGYQDLDARGYQILLNYRSPNHIAQEVTLTQVLNGKLPPQWVKNRIILIGSTAPSLKDSFYTPYSSGQRGTQKMPGVMVHAQIVSQLLSAVLDGQPVLWFWPQWGEALWIWSWSLTGGVLGWRLRHSGLLILAVGMSFCVLLGTSWILFTQAGWIPLVPPALALVLSSGGITAYRIRQADKEREKIVQQAKEQEEIIAQLNQLLKGTNLSTTLPNQTLSEEETAETTALVGDEETAEATAIAPSQRTTDNGSEIETSLPYSTSWKPSSLKNRYQILKALGSGGFGLTFLAEDTQRPSNPQCVVKLLKPARRDEKFLNLARRLFNTEADILEKLGHHTQIPQLLAYFEENQEFYLVQELIEGHPLSDELPVDQRLPEAQVADLMHGVLEILAFIHAHGVIHRDIKPSNIIRRQQDGRLVLIDFGAVKQIQPQESSEQENLTVVIGTRGYTPPEQLHGFPKLSSDIYALGMIGIQALTGIHPNNLSPDQLTGNICWRHLAAVGEEFGRILDKMVRYNFLERYQFATEVLQDLKRLEI